MKEDIFEFNFFHVNLTLLSFLDDQKPYKIDFFFEICSNLNRNFTFFDFNNYLFSFLYNNLYTVTKAIYDSLEKCKDKETVKLDLQFLLKKVYNEKNIQKYKENIIFNFNKKIYESIYVMSKPDIEEIFLDKGFIFNNKDLREHFLFTNRDLL